MLYNYIQITKYRSRCISCSSKNYEKKWNLKYPFSRLEIAGTFHIAE